MHIYLWEGATMRTGMRLFWVALVWISLLPSSGGARGAAELTGSWNVQVLGQLSREAYVVAVRGAYAYIGVGMSVAVVNVSNPSDPWVMGQTSQLPDNVQAIFVAGSYAYVADQDAGLRILNVSDPYNPREVGYYQTPGTAKGVVVVNNLAYVADHDMGLRIVNVSNPFNPYEVGAYETPGNASGVAVAGNLAYIAERGTGLRIVNISNPASPYQVGFLNTGGNAYSVALMGNLAYVADGAGLRVVNVSSPSNPYQVGYYDAPGNVWGVEVEGNLAYVSCFNAGLRIANVADPTNPTEVGYYEEGQVYTMALANGLAYVARGGNGLVILRYVGTSAPAAPSNLTATAVSSSQINLSWRDNSSDESGFRVYRNGALLATLGAGVTSYQNIGLPCGTYYSYYVTAYNAGGESSPSNTAGATTHPCSAPPTPAVVRLPVILRGYALPGGPPEEWRYDDGVKDHGAIATDPGYAMEVRFNAVQRRQILRLRYYLYQLGNPVRLYVRDNSGERYSREVTPSVPGGEGWFDWDVSGNRIYVQGPFSVGFESRAGGGPALGRDETAPIDGYSYQGPLGNLQQVTDADFMIRVLVSGPVTGSTVYLPVMLK